MAQDLNKIIDWWDGDAKTAQVNRYAYWIGIKRVKTEYDDIKPDCTFNDYVLNTYGIKMLLDNSGFITGEYDVVNQDLYTFFLLKFKH